MKPVIKFTYGVVVKKEGSVGIVDSCEFCLELKFKDGSIGLFSKPVEADLHCLDLERLEDDDR